MKKILILVAPGFEEIELSAPYDILKRLRYQVVTAGINNTEIEGAHGLRVKTDITVDEADAEGFDAVILPGGSGAEVLRDTPKVIEIIQKMNKEGKLIAAICAAPIALAKAGVITSKNVSAYPATTVFEELEKSFVTGDRITLDGNILTAKGPAVSLDFGFAIGDYLGRKHDEIAELKKAMIYGH